MSSARILRFEDDFFEDRFPGDTVLNNDAVSIVGDEDCPEVEEEGWEPQEVHGDATLLPNSQVGVETRLSTNSYVTNVSGVPRRHLDNGLLTFRCHVI